MSRSSASPTDTPPRIAYLLADGGIPFAHSQKGSSIHARSMIRAFQQEGCPVDVFAMRKGKQAIKGFSVHQVHQRRQTRWFMKQVLGDGPIRRLLAGGAGRPAPNWATALGIMLWQRDFYRDTLARCRKRPPELLYARNAWLAWPYAALKRKLGAPLVLEVNAVLTIEKDARGEIAFPGRSRRHELEAFRAADLILPVSAELKEQIVSLGIAPDKIVVTPNAVDLELFHPRGAEDRQAGRFTIGAVNSFKAYHGMETLLAAAPLLREAIPGLRLRLIGGGEALPPMRELAASLGIADLCEFTGTVDHQRVPALLRECDVCVAPYQGPQNQYNCPMKLYEYMALKIPVVAARWGDIPNIVQDGATALLHREADPADLAARVLEVWREPEAAARRVEAAYALIQNHTWRAIARRILEWRGVRATEEAGIA